MKVLINAKKLAPILSELSRIPPSRSTLPILMNALLVAEEDGTLRITTTDLNMTMTRVITAEVKEPGTATVPIARINELVSVFPDQMVTLKFDDKKDVLKVSCAGTKSDLKTIPAMDFPITEPSGKPLFSMDLNAGELMSALREVVFAASEEIARPLLQGVMFDIEPGLMKLAGADGFRLAWRELYFDNDKPLAKFTILADGIREIIKMLSGQENVNIKVWPGMDHIKFSVNDAEMLVVALNGEYPDFSPMFEKFKERTTKAEVPIGAFGNACRACAVIAKDTSYITKMSITSSNGSNEMGSIVMSALGSEIGSAESSVDAAVTGETIEVGVNLKMVQEILSALSDGELSIELLGTTNPMIFRPVGRDDYFNVIMPMGVPGTK